MSDDRNEAMRLADAARIAELEQALDRLQGNYLIAFERGRIAGIAELEARVHTCGPTCSKAGCINRRLTADRDQLRAEVERLRKDGERLDWLQQAMGEADEKVPQLCTDTGEFFFIHTQDGQEFVESGTFELRRIIDSAIAIDRAIEAAKEA